MLLRRITQHVKDQNWFAVFIDFIIVVVGVFIGIQVANWNDEQAFIDKETELLKELKLEVETGIAYVNYIHDSYTQVSDAGKRSLKFISEKKSCSDNCWSVLVDFMHASQWQDTRVNRQIYDEMRRLGLPSSKKITQRIDLFLEDNEASSLNFDDKPYYRELVRQLVAIDVQDFYWKHCYNYLNGKEYYSLNCPKGATDEISKQLVNAIAQHPDIYPHLTQWTSQAAYAPNDNSALNKEAQDAIQAIDEELESR